MKLSVFKISVFFLTFPSLSFGAPVSVSAYIPKIKYLCNAITEDGRADTVINIMEQNPVRDGSCNACKSLFGSFKEACKNKTIKLKKGQKAAEPIKKQREPNATVIHFVSELSSDMSEDPKNKFELYAAMKKLFLLLSGPYKGRAEGEVEYFSIMQTYLDAGFTDVKNELKTHADETDQKKDDQKSKKMDDLFE